MLFPGAPDPVAAQAQREIVDKLQANHLPYNTFILLRDLSAETHHLNLPEIQLLKVARALLVSTDRSGRSSWLNNDGALLQLMQTIKDSSPYNRGSSKTLITETLRMFKLEHIAVPDVESCVVCSSQRLVTEQRNSTTYFYTLFEPGAQGTVFIKKCLDCSHVHTPGGHERPEHFGRASGHKCLYETVQQPQCSHPRYFESTSQTFIDERLFHLAEGIIHFTQGGFEPTARIHNYMAGK